MLHGALLCQFGALPGLADHFHDQPASDRDIGRHFSRDLPRRVRRGKVDGDIRLVRGGWCALVFHRRRQLQHDQVRNHRSRHLAGSNVAWLLR